VADGRRETADEKRLVAEVDNVPDCPLDEEALYAG
jgi:hypothetical protein